MLFTRIALLVAMCSCHHLPCHWDITPSSPLTKIQDEADSPPHPSNTDNHDAAEDGADNDAGDADTDNNAEGNANNDADVNADNDNAMQMMDDDADNRQ